MYVPSISFTSSSKHIHTYKRISMFQTVKSILATLSLVALTATLSCSGNKGNSVSDATANAAGNDTVLRVAILPVRECEILRYAQESGLASRMGLKMELLDYDAMMDIDTAVLSGNAHVYFEDTLRICRIKNDSLRPELLLPIPVNLRLVANKDKDIDNIRDLKTNMVGLTRWSQLEEWMTEISASAALEQMDVYHAQINSIPLRFKMVNDGLIEAAIVPQPWADSLCASGHKTLKDTISGGMGFYICPSIKSDSLLLQQARMLRKVYLQALKQTQTQDNV